MIDKTPLELADENSSLREELDRWHTLFPDMTSLGGDLAAVADAVRQLDADKAALIEALILAVELIDDMNDLINDISGTRLLEATRAQAKCRAVLARVKGDKP